MQDNNTSSLHQTPAQMRSKAFIGSSTVNLILLVSFVASAAYWYALSVQASSSEVSGLWEILLWSIVAVGVVTELVKKVTLSTFRHKSIWLGATFVSVLTVMGTFSILDASRESGLIKQSDQYKTAQARSEGALNDASTYAWASSFNLDQLNNQLQQVVSDREKRTIRYQAYLSKKKAINEKIQAKRAYDSAIGMQTMAGEVMGNSGAGATSSNPLLSNIATATGVGANILKTSFYLAVTLLLEFAAFYIGGRVEELKNKMNMTRAQLLDIQNRQVFGISMLELHNEAFEGVVQAENERIEAEQEVKKLRQNREGEQAGITAQKIQEVRADSKAKTIEAKAPFNEDNKPKKAFSMGFINTDNRKPEKSVDVDKPMVTESVITESVITESVITESVGTESVGTESVGTESVGTESVITESLATDINRMTALYNRARNAPSGEHIECPVCETKIIKKGLKTFCSNSRNKRSDGGSCLDEYHNAIKPERLEALANKRRKAGRA